MEFTEHQVRTLLVAVGFDAEHVDEGIERLRQMPRNAGALGLTDDELKGTAR